MVSSGTPPELFVDFVRRLIPPGPPLRQGDLKITKGEQRVRV